MKISYALNVLNGEPFIWYQLNSIYKHAHEILIVEGAYKKFAHAAKYFRSTDNTISIIKSYPDPGSKIKLITRNYYYDDRVGMCNEFMDELTGDVLWQIDVDEFYSDETHIYVKKLFEEKADLDQISFNFIDYYAGFDYVIKGYHNSLLDVIRVNRIFNGMRWYSQRPPTLEINGKELMPRNKINGSQMSRNGHLMHNATMLFEKQVKDKFKYYTDMWPKSVMGSELWFDSSWKNFETKFCVAGMKETLTYLVPRSSPLPEALKVMQEDINNGSYEGFVFSSHKVEYKITQDHNYQNKVLISEKINMLVDTSFICFISTSVRILMSLLYLPQNSDKYFIKSIFILNIKKWCKLTIRKNISKYFHILNKLRGLNVNS